MSIKVVVLASLIFFDSLDSPLLVLTFLLQLSNLSRVRSACRMARNNRMLRITREIQGIKWTNNTRNLKKQKKSFPIIHDVLIPPRRGPPYIAERAF
jgi:hypothetical protein